jgi:hypothetical protein
LKAIIQHNALQAHLEPIKLRYYLGKIKLQ